MARSTRSRARSRRAARRRQRRTRARHSGHALQALTSAALALPGFAPAARADAPAQRVIAEYGYSYYTEDELPDSKVTEGGETQRYEIHAHQIRLAAPVSDRFDLGLALVHETLSGATPWYVIPDVDGDPVQVMTGATIEEARTDALVRASYYLDSGRANLAAGISTENDYFAWNGELSGERHFNEKNTTLSGGGGFSIDSLEPSDAGSDEFRPSHAERQSYSVFAGISQVIGRGGVLGSTARYQHGRGYLSDPYKRVLVEGAPIGDSRPDARNQFSWDAGWRQHVDVLDASIHADYRFFIDDWAITSHTIEMAWYQSLWSTIRLIPSFRYYSQSQAEFYGPWFDTAPSDGYASSDYRLSPFGAMAWRVRAETLFSTWRIDWKAAIAYERYESNADWALGKVAVANPGLVSFHLLSVSLTARF